VFSLTKPKPLIIIQLKDPFAAFTKIKLFLTPALDPSTMLLFIHVPPQKTVEKISQIQKIANQNYFWNSLQWTMPTLKYIYEV
jgi:hypothetical protein